MAHRARWPRVAVMGGSLGGLTAGLVLRDLGCEVDVYERSATPLESRGAGIVLHPATVRYLIENSEIELAEVSSSANRVQYLNSQGAVAHETVFNYRFTSYFTLYRGLLESFDRSRYHLGIGVTGFEQSRASVSVRLSAGEELECALLVCADGIHSSARETLLAVGLAYAGYVGWRGTVAEADLSPTTSFTLADAVTYYVMPYSHMLVYPIPGQTGSVAQDERLMNFVWYRNVENAALGNLMTDDEGNRYSSTLPPGRVASRHLKELRETATAQLPPLLAEMVHKTKEPFVQVVFDNEVSRMAFGRICLIGDAAFALRPHAAVGTAKAAEDAWKLAEAVKSCRGDVVAALKAWEPGQLALGRRVLERTRQVGVASQVAGTWRTGDPLPFGLYEIGDSAM